MKIATLKRRAEFLRLKSGHKWATPAFVLQGAPRDVEGESNSELIRFGFTVSDRAIASPAADGRKRGGSVKRNRAKRRLKEAVRLTAGTYAKAGYDYVVIGRAQALNRNFADLLADMKIAFHKVHAAQDRGMVSGRMKTGLRYGRKRPASTQGTA